MKYPKSLSDPIYNIKSLGFISTVPAKLIRNKKEKRKELKLPQTWSKKELPIWLYLGFVLTCTFIIMSINLSSKRNREKKLPHLAETLYLLPHSLIPLVQESVPRLWSKSTQVRDCLTSQGSLLGHPIVGCGWKLGWQNGLFPQKNTNWKVLTALRYLVCRQKTNRLSKRQNLLNVWVLKGPWLCLKYDLKPATKSIICGGDSCSHRSSCLLRWKWKNFRPPTPWKGSR